MGDYSYEEALTGLYSLAGRLPPRQYLKGMRALLERLKNPQGDFESVIVTGTNGRLDGCDDPGRAF
jgi:folylpolyglutamate synthase/dihydropteroate synthase